MKLNELNQIEEGIFSAIRDRFQQGGEQTKVQNIFINDFVQDAITSLNNGIKGGLIDPNIKSSAAPGPTAPSPVEKTKGQIVTLDGKDYRWEGAQWVDTTTGRIVDKATSERLNSMPPAVLTKGKVVKLGGKNYRWEGAQWVDTTTGRVADKTTSDQLKAMFAAPEVTESIHSTYHKMNKIFENIININEEEVALRTISDFMIDWFSQYMKGVQWETSKAIVQQKLNKLQDEYPKNIKKNLEDLARIGLALSKSGTPAGAPDEFVRSRKEAAASVDDLKASLDKLAKTDPKAYNELIKNLKPIVTESIAITESRHRK